MFWNPFTCFLKSFFSFTINFILTFSSHSSGFSIRHTENIISLDSSVDTTVSWNWFSKSLDTSCLLHWVYSEEWSSSASIWLISGTWTTCTKRSIIFSLFHIITSLFFNSGIWNWCTIESMNLSWWNWLQKLKKEFRIKFCNRINMTK